MNMKLRLSVAVLGWTAGVVLAASPEFKFDFGTSSRRTDATLVAATNVYSAAAGFGFESPASLAAGKDFVSSPKPFRFSVMLPEGNYLVTVGLGGADAAVVTIKAEARRLMLEQVRVPAGELVRGVFTVNVRRPEFGENGRVRLKQRERDTEMITWDDRLTLEFNGTNPAVRSVDITPAKVPTIFLCGDSTVCDQPAEPWNSWGQMLPRFFGPGGAVANYAESGESIKSSLGAKRFDKVFSLMNSNDWLLVQFGHNDMKDKATNALVTYKANLKQIVQRTREHGGTPVLVTSMERKAGVEHDTLAGYPQVVREVAREDQVALIDLHTVSKVFYRALGADLDQAFQDGTHHNNYGSYELARCVVEGLRTQVPRLAALLRTDLDRFDPAHPDRITEFQMAVSPEVSALKPDGN